MSGIDETQREKFRAMADEQYLKMHPCPSCADKDRTIALRDAEVARLREELEKYGSHRFGCHARYKTPEECTCGLDAAKEGR